MGRHLPLWDAFLERWLIADEDTPEQWARKDATLRLLFLAACTTTACAAALAAGGRGWPVVTSLVAAAAVIPFGVYQARREAGVSREAAAACCGTAFVAVVLWDLWGAAGMTGRAWPLLLLVGDILPAARTGARHYMMWAVGTLAWVLLVEVERHVRFGLFDVPGAPSQAARAAVCGCAAPPCAIGGGTEGDLFDLTPLSVVVVCVAYHHLFAERLVREKDATICVTQQIAQCVSVLDVAEARGVLSRRRGELDPLFDAAMAMVLEELDDIRAYVPKHRLALARDPSLCQSSVASWGATSGFGGHDDHASAPPTPKNAGGGWCEDVSKLANVSSLSALEGSQHSASSSRNDRIDNGDFAPPPMALAALARRRSSAGSIASASGVRRVKDAALKREAVTLVAVNMHDSIRRINEAGLDFRRLHEVTLQSILCHNGSDGIVDRVVGDRTFVSFNASKRCASHALSAVGMAVGVANNAVTPVTVAVTTGHAVCGNIGCSDMRCFGILGPLPVLLDNVLRLGTMWDHKVVCTNVTRQEVWFKHETRLALQRVTVRKHRQPEGETEPCLLWEVVMPGCTTASSSPVSSSVPPELSPAGSPRSCDSDEEWMYHVVAGEDKWDAWNKAAKLVLAGSDAQGQGSMEVHEKDGIISTLFGEHLAKMQTHHLVL